MVVLQRITPSRLNPSKFAPVRSALVRWENEILVGSDPVRNKQMKLKVVSPHMIDPKGERMHA